MGIPHQQISSLPAYAQAWKPYHARGFQSLYFYVRTSMQPSLGAAAFGVLFLEVGEGFEGAGHGGG